MVNAAAGVGGLRYRGGKAVYDKTLQTVLGERPCRVIGVSDPPSHPGATGHPGNAGRRMSRTGAQISVLGS